MLNFKDKSEAGDRHSTGELAPQTKSARDKMLLDRNQKKTDFPSGKCVHDLFEKQVELSPEAMALAFADERLTYRQLNQRANQLAHHLRARKIGPHSLVGVHTGRSADFVVAILAVLKAGGAYIPLDIEYPVERLRLLVSDADLDGLICDGINSLELVAGDLPVVHLQRDIVEISGQPETNLGWTIDPEQLAYVLFTSGSTGRPKGVCMPHRPLVNLLHWQNGQSAGGAGQRTLQFAPLGFDVCFQEIFSTLTSGGMLAIASSAERKDFIGLLRLIENAQITRIFLPFVALEFLAEVVADTRLLPVSLREVITAGEQLRISPAIRSLFGALNKARLINQYGPTETHVVSAFELTGDPAGWPYLPSIGRPIANTRLYILDPQRQPVAAGEIGELYIGGVQVAQGYLNRPELSAERFLADPFGTTPGGRLYRTGDLARHFPDGTIEFLGRSDDQVKIRGFRIELGEIETMLASHPEIQRVVVLAREDLPGEKFLAAYLIVRHQLPQLISQLREFLSRKLPDYMIPAVFVTLAAFPLTPNGKIDRKALPVPDPDQFESGVDYVAPQTHQEQKLAGIWCEVLGLSQVGLNDNFFLIGGDSLLAVKLMLQVEKSTGQWLELSTFLLKPTLAGLCAALQARREPNNIEIVVPIRQVGTRPPLCCIYNITGDVDMYFSLAEALGEDQPVIGIRSPALGDLSQLPVSIEAAAAEIVRSIRKLQPNGTPALVGYSWAGLLAFEVARQLEQAEGVHCFIALIGPDAPIPPINLVSRVTHFARYFPSWLWRLARERENRRHRLSRWKEMARSSQQVLTEVNLAVPDWADSPISRHLLALAKNYRPASKCKATAVIFRELDEYRNLGHPLHVWKTAHLPDAGWSRWMRNSPRIQWVHGNHANVINPPIVTGLAESIRTAMDEHFAFDKTLEHSSMPTLETQRKVNEAGRGRARAKSRAATARH